MNRQDRTKRIDSICEVTWIPLCARDGSAIKWGRGQEETLSIHVVWTLVGVSVRSALVAAELYFSWFFPLCTSFLNLPRPTRFGTFISGPLLILKPSSSIWATHFCYKFGLFWVRMLFITYRMEFLYFFT